MSDPETLLIVNRAAMFAAAALAFGGPLLLTLLAPPDLKCALLANIAGVLRASTLVLLTTALASLPLASAVIAEDWAGALDTAVIAALATGTDAGPIAIVRIILAALAVAAARGLSRPQTPPVAHPPLAALSALLIASFAFTGHAALHDGPLRLAHQLNHTVHVLAGLFWLGALVPLAAAARILDEPRHSAAAARLLLAFATAGAAAVVLVLLSGTINTALILGRAPLDGSSAYQALLTAKIVCVLCMLGLAVLNRFWLVPRAAAGSDKRLLQRTILAEVVLGILVIALVATFGTLEPV